MKRAIIVTAAAVVALALFWTGIGIGAASRAEVKESGDCRIECWDNGTVVIYTDQEHIKSSGNYVVIRRDQ